MNILLDTSIIIPIDDTNRVLPVDFAKLKDGLNLKYILRLKYVELNMRFAYQTQAS